jgi:gluconolactonase
VRLDPAIDRIVSRGASIEKLASGFQFTEGPVWHPDGFLLFSDPNANTIYRWTTDGQVTVFRTKSGYAGIDVGEYRQPGSNGLTLDAEGRLVIDEHGRRRVVRLEPNGLITVVADRYEGKRLNSPNDLVYKSDGALYFTDPPFGLPRVFDDPRKELPFSGVYRLANGKMTLLTSELTGPNGLAFSPDERFLYVANWDVARKVVMRYPVMPDGSLGAGHVFIDATKSHPGEQAWDGVKVDRDGNVYAAGPGGVWVVSPEGKHLGTIEAPEAPANIAWGDEDGRTLYMTAITGLYRIRLEVPGIRPEPTARTARSGR